MSDTEIKYIKEALERIDHNLETFKKEIRPRLNRLEIAFLIFIAFMFGVIVSDFEALFKILL